MHRIRRFSSFRFDYLCNEVAISTAFFLLILPNSATFLGNSNEVYFIEGLHTAHHRPDWFSLPHFFAHSRLEWDVINSERMEGEKGMFGMCVRSAWSHLTNNSHFNRIDLNILRLSHLLRNHSQISYFNFGFIKREHSYSIWANGIFDIVPIIIYVQRNFKFNQVCSQLH